MNLCLSVRIACFRATSRSANVNNIILSHHPAWDIDLGQGAIALSLPRLFGFSGVWDFEDLNTSG